MLFLSIPPAASQKAPETLGSGTTRGVLRAYIDPASRQLIGILPSGQTIDTNGSTTGGLEEIFRAMCDNDTSLSLDSSGSKGVINLSTPIDFVTGLRAADGSRAPCPMQAKTINIGWLTLNWTTTLGSSSGITFDSLMDVTFNFDGQSVYQGAGCAWRFRPTHPVPIDKFVTVSDNEFRIAFPGSQSLKGPATDCLVELDATNGAIVNLTLAWVEMNGGGCPTCNTSANVGLRLIGGRHGISMSHFRGGRIHGWTKTGIQCGLTPEDGKSIQGNVFDTALLPSGKPSDSTTGVEVNCPKNSWLIGSINGSETAGQVNAFKGIVVGRGISGNKFIAPDNRAATPVASGAGASAADIRANSFVK
jgi:hypothetical protein